MNDLTLRLLLVGAVVLVAGVAALAARRYGAPYHRPIQTAGIDLPPGIVVFTSTECSKCKRVLARAKKVGAPLREVTYELERPLFEAAGIEGVPLTVVVDQSGRVIAQMAGLARIGSLRRAVARAG